MKIRKIATAAICIALPVAGTAQGAAPPANPRIEGLAGCADILTGVEALLHNPAGVSAVGAHTFGFSVTSYHALPELNATQLAAAFPLGSQKGGLGVSVSSSGTKGLRENGFDLYYARKLTETLALGVGSGLALVQIRGYRNQISGRLSAGVQASLHEFLDLGIAFTYLHFNGFSGTTDAGGRIELGLGWLITDSVVAYAGLTKELRNPVRIRTGLEYTFSRKFTIRCGFRSAPATIHLGLGIILGRLWRTDLGMRFHPVLGMTPTIGLIISAK